jgi:diguanylate cyclase (GGDEF)-like protein/PAS domain S-box-containing protein
VNQTEMPRVAKRISKPASEALLVYAEQVDLAYQQGLRAMAINPLVALGLVGAQWRVIDRQVAIAWFGFLLCTTAARIALVLRYRAASPAPAHAVTWGKRHILSSLLAGTVWGLGALALYPPQSFSHQLVLLLWLLGILSSMVPSYSMIPASFYAVLYPMMTMTIVRIVSGGDRIHVYLGLGTVFFTAITTLYMRRIHETMVHSLRLRFANHELIRDLEHSRALLRSTLESTADGILAITSDGEVISHNGKLLEMWGWSLSALNPGNARQRLRSVVRQLQEPTALLRRLRASARSTSSAPLVDLLALRDGRFFEMHMLAQRAEAHNIGWVFSFRDVTASKHNEDRIRHLALHDPLTGLANRTLLEEHIKQAIARARRSKDPVAVMFLDLDNFKPINDAHGHMVGDAVLRETAQRLRGCLRESDSLARIGGDEFVVVAQGASDRDSLEGVAKKILANVSKPMSVEGHTCQVGVSVGVSIYPDDGRDAQSLLNRADQAMYAAKVAGKNQIRFATRIAH